ncbi:probable 1,4-beta-D-glucan cellobiohydrolase A [Daphnia pulicaria]|uniref:probable 1,4-beta-D-glucan cellobiohydrolase A n=1 Tax=Daphnia pulicaria TaxID=35523 RepID=UPI001EEC2734|nr:probable 1,4-beta-D-glucan cellobiohydrolase A [Daphnia pulicaria]
MGMVCYYGPGNYKNPSQSEYESGRDITFRNGNQMTLAITGRPTIEARTFLTTGTNSNRRLLNKELSFEVDVTACGCGMNFTLCFILMESDGGQSSFGYTGATYGTGYCDDSQPAELDIWEASNSSTSV